MPLTDTAIRAVKPTTKAAKLFDGGSINAPAGNRHEQRLPAQPALP